MTLKLEDRAAPLNAAAVESCDVVAAKPTSSYIPTLDGWRAIAIGLVIGAHSQVMLVHNGSHFARLLATFFKHTGYGVDIFFALSGYLICTLLLREKERTGTIGLSRFYTRRAFRILPPMLVYVAFIVALSSFRAIPAISIREILATLFFFRNYIDGSWYTGHFWSLAVEEHFYAFIPLLLLTFNRRLAVRCLSLLILSCIGIRWFEYAQGGASRSLIQFYTENRIDCLLWGALLAIALQERPVRAWIARHLSPLVLCGVFLVALALLLRFDSQPVRRTIIAAALPFFLGYTVLKPHSFLGRALEFPWLKWIGRLSYSLYIWQMMFLPEGGRPLGVVQEFPLNLILPFICASLSFYLIEKPMIRLGHKFAGAPGATSPGRL